MVGKPLDCTNTEVDTSSFSDKSDSVVQEEQMRTYNELPDKSINLWFTSSLIAFNFWCNYDTCCAT